MLLTLGTFAFITALICGLSLGDDKHNKKHPFRLLWLIPLILIAILFERTGSIPDYNKIVKHSTEKWHTIYKNNINADVTVATDDITLNPKKPITRKDKEKLFTKGQFIQFSLSSNTVTITATNKNDSTSKEAKLTEDNFIEKWPKGTNPDKSSGRITKIEYRSTPFTLKWFGLTVKNKSYDETRITVEYNGTNDPSTKQLFSEN
jgi:hypothetical protein